MARLKPCPPGGVGDGGSGDRLCWSNTSYSTMNRVYLSSSSFNGTSCRYSWRVTFEWGMRKMKKRKGRVDSGRQAQSEEGPVSRG
jgi:hypothetical protein